MRRLEISKTLHSQQWARAAWQRCSAAANCHWLMCASGLESTRRLHNLKEEQHRARQSAHGGARPEHATGAPRLGLSGAVPDSLIYHVRTMSKDPAMSMSNASIPVFEIGLNALSAILDKAETMRQRRRSIPRCCSTRASSPICSRSPARCRARATWPRTAAHGSPASTRPGMRTTRRRSPSSKPRIAKTLAFVKTLDAKKIDKSADREITFPLGPNNRAT